MHGIIFHKGQHGGK